MARNETESTLHFQQVFDQELAAIKEVRKWALDAKLRLPFETQVGPHPEMPIGLALSGGGVRAATFHLGVLQALAEHGILVYLDYLSAVSGGGFIASWLCKWLSQEPFDVVLRKLSGPIPMEPGSWLHHLRKNSSYLTPRLGLSEDTLLLFTTYAHQLFLSSLVLSLVATLILIIPQLVLSGFAALYGAATWWRAAVALIGGLLAVASAYIFTAGLWGPRKSDEATTARERLAMSSVFFVAGGASVLVLLVTNYYPQWPYAVASGLALGIAIDLYWKIRYRPSTFPTAWPNTCVGLSFVSSFMIVFTLFRNSPSEATHSRPLFLLARHYLSPPKQHALAWGLGSLIVLISLSLCLNQTLLRTFVGRISASFYWSVKFILAMLLTAGLAAYTIYRTGDIRYHLTYMGVDKALSPDLQDLARLNHIPLVLTLITPGLIVLSVSIVALHVSLLSRLVLPYVRETAVRVAGQLYKVTLLWTITSTVSFYGPLALYTGNMALVYWFIVVWVISLIGTIRLGRRRTWEVSRIRTTVERCVGYLAFIVFVGGCWILTSWLCHRFLLGLKWHGIEEYWCDLVHVPVVPLIGYATALLVLLMLLSARIGINSSSMHAFYEARVAEAYLREGWRSLETLQSSASLDSLCPCDATAEIGYRGPYLLLNAALNLPHVEDLALQERQATSFVFSPLFCGYRRSLGTTPATPDAFQPTRSYGYDGAHGVGLARAVSISGSAVNTNMGRATSVRTRFLYSVLNLRLGWWMSNPRFTETWTGTVPRARIHLLWKELRGTSDDRGPYVNLSDGGHFENLGLYELIRRRCSVIIASDASEDAGAMMSSLASAISKSRSDFGVSIDLDDPGKLLRVEDGQRPVVMFGRIRYSANPAEDGLFIYLRPGLLGVKAAPLDVQAFAASNPSFPYDPTVNQWFRESRFESYRMLGHTTGSLVARELRERTNCDEFIRQIQLLTCMR